MFETILQEPLRDAAKTWEATLLPVSNSARKKASNIAQISRCLGLIKT
jgi:hypothetical protein